MVNIDLNLKEIHNILGLCNELNSRLKFLFQRRVPGRQKEVEADRGRREKMTEEGDQIMRFMAFLPYHLKKLIPGRAPTCI